MARVSYIAIAGNIGCGKSSLVDYLCRTYGVAPFFEPNATNPYLEDFYVDMPRWAFQSQLYFLTHKFRIHRELEALRRKTTIIQDRTIYEDAEIFAAHLYHQGFIEDRDWQLYQELYQTISKSLEPPDLMIYLKSNVRTIRKRIKQRGRPEEQKIPTPYLKKLNELYAVWFANYQLSPTITLETDRIDYMSNLVDRIDLHEAVQRYL